MLHLRQFSVQALGLLPIVNDQSGNGSGACDHSRSATSARFHEDTSKWYSTSRAQSILRDNKLAQARQTGLVKFKGVAKIEAKVNYMIKN